MEERKQIGFSVLIFLVAFAGVLFMAYRKVLGRHALVSSGRDCRRTDMTRRGPERLAPCAFCAKTRRNLRAP